MNEGQIRAVLAKEVNASNLSELAKSFILELLDNGHIPAVKKEPHIIRFMGSKTAEVESGPELTQPKPTSHKHSVVRSTSEIERVREQIMNKISLAIGTAVNNPGKEVKLLPFLDEFKTWERNWVYKMLKQQIKSGKMSNIILITPPNLKMSYSIRAGNTVPTTETKTKQYEHPKDFRTLQKKPTALDSKEFRRSFMSEKTKYHMKAGFDYLKASAMAGQDYSAYCHRRDKIDSVQPVQPVQPTIITTPEFPELKYITPESQKLLIDILRKLDTGQIKQLTEFMDSYVLNIPENAWPEFLADLLSHNASIKAALGFSKDKDFVLRYRTLTFE